MTLRLFRLKGGGWAVDLRHVLVSFVSDGHALAGEAAFAKAEWDEMERRFGRVVSFERRVLEGAGMGVPR